MSDYAAFLAGRERRAANCGRDPDEALIPDALFPFQRDLVRWAIRKGRAALFCNTGLGKTAMQAAWARQVPGDVLIAAPLAVATQTVAEAAKFGIAVNLARDDADFRPGINVTNYDRLHRHNPRRYAGVALDESSIIKHHTAKTLAQLMEMFSATPFKLCCTATPSPNDYTELGTHAEFLGVCRRPEMLAEYFCHDGGDTQSWRLKGHAEQPFWRWVASWAALVRMPSDLGYEDGGFQLPPLRVTQHVLPVDPETVKAGGLLFAEAASSLMDRRRARKASVAARVAECAALVNASRESWIVWCDLNAESEALTEAIDGAVEITGSMDNGEKESKLIDFAAGRVRVLVTKPSIAGFGLSWQHCSRVAFVGVTDSFESYFQAVRRCWRFGQTHPVDVHVFASEAEGNVTRNLARKERDAEIMAEQLAKLTAGYVREELGAASHAQAKYDARQMMQIPAWLTGEPAHVA